MRKGCRCRAYRRRSPPSRFPAPPCSRAKYGRPPGRCRPGLVLGHTRTAPFHRRRAILSHRPIPAGGPALTGGDATRDSGVARSLLACCRADARVAGPVWTIRQATRYCKGHPTLDAALLLVWRALWRHHVFELSPCGGSGYRYPALRSVWPHRAATALEKHRERANARVPYPAPALPDRRAAARRSPSCPYSGASPPASSVPRRRGAAPGPAPRRAPRRSARHRCGW